MRCQQKRPVRECMNCRNGKPIVAHGLSEACYKADQRAAARAEDTQAASKEGRKLEQDCRRQYNQIVSALRARGVPIAVVDKIRTIICPYFPAIAYEFRDLELSTTEETGVAEPEPAPAKPLGIRSAVSAVREAVNNGRIVVSDDMPEPLIDPEGASADDILERPERY